MHINEPGVYYGECNQICGTNHSAMPIAVEAKSPEEFAKWVEAGQDPRPAGRSRRCDRKLASVAQVQR